MFAAIGGVIASFAIVIKFIKSILVKYLVHSVIITLQFALTASTIIFVMAFYGFTITALISVFNLGIDTFNYASTSSNSSLSCLFGLLGCTGIAPAIQNGFAMLYSALSTVVIFHLFKFTMGAMRMIMNEVFKLGVLLGQALS